MQHRNVPQKGTGSMRSQKDDEKKKQTKKLHKTLRYFYKYISNMLTWYEVDILLYPFSHADIQTQKDK
jgi:hypothetical protein